MSFHLCSIFIFIDGSLKNTSCQHFGLCVMTQKDCSQWVKVPFTLQLSVKEFAFYLYVSFVNSDFRGDFNFSLPCHLIMLERRLTCVQSILLKRDNPNQKQCELTVTTNIRKGEDMHVESNRCCSCPLLHEGYCKIFVL